MISESNDTIIRSVTSSADIARLHPALLDCMIIYMHLYADGYPLKASNIK